MNLAKSLILLILFSINIGAFRAQQPYQFDRWTIDQGLPQSSVRAIVRTHDGYLWLGTFEGLSRFDGLNFTTFNNVNTPEIKSNFIGALLEDKQGDLWVGIEGGEGLIKRANGNFKLYSKSDGFCGDSAMSLLETRDGAIWAGTLECGINVISRDGEITHWTTANGLPDNRIEALAEDAAGSVWIGTNKGLARLSNGIITVLTKNENLPDGIINALLWDDAEEGLWIGTNAGLSLLKDGKFANLNAENNLSIGAVEIISKDLVGNLWIGTRSSGLLRYRKGEAASPQKITSLPDQRICSIHVDTDNNVWIGGWTSGLHRFRKKLFRPLSSANGKIEEDFVRAVFEDRAGNLWYSTEHALKRFKDGALIEYQPEVTQQNSIGSIAEDSAGNLWFGGGSGVSRFSAGKFTLLQSADGLINDDVSSIIGSRDGSVWIGTANGLSVFRGGKFTGYTTADGLTNNFILSLYEDREGAVWCGTSNGINRFKNGKLSGWTSDESLTGNQAISFYEDQNGALWIGTGGSGLIRFKDGKFTRITSRDGLYDNLAFQILDDDRGNLWMCGNKGFYRANLGELNDFADRRRDSVNSYSYGTTDGALSRECNGASPAGWKTRGGDLWFSTTKGLAALDETQINSQPSAVIVEQIRIDNQPSEDKIQVEIKPNQENLEIQYTGINWVRPREIRFKYKLENLDHDWIEAGTRRTAYYSHLPPGEYVFKIAADNGDGIWSAEDITVNIKVLPPFYRTWWFAGLCFLLLIGFGYLIYSRRVAQLEKGRLVQEEFTRRLINAHESERRRIAAELHDSIGQSLAMIKNRAVFGAEMIADEDARRHLEQITAQTAQTISEVREISYNLRPHLLDQLGLKKSIVSLLNQLDESGKIKIYSIIEDIDNLFEKEAELSIYRIVQESIGNIIKHAEATEAEVYLQKGERNLTIIISDNGKGFDFAKIKFQEGGNGGFGLFGIGERVRMMGGRREIETEINGGTTLYVTIPLTKFD